MNNENMLGDFIYQRRKELGLSQLDLADLIGVSNKAVSKWETKEANPDVKNLKLLANALKCTVDELLSCKISESNNKFKMSHKKIFGLNGLFLNTSEQLEFISDKQNKKGKPFLHINIGKSLDKIGTKAEGVIAIGNIAKGKIALGFVSKGIISLGFISLGILSFGIIAVSLLLSLGILCISTLAAIGSVAIGGIAVGAVAIGIVSIGALSIGVYAHTSNTGHAIGIYEFIHNNWSNKK